MWLFQLSWLMNSIFVCTIPQRIGFWKNYLWTSLSFSYGLIITCIILRQVIYLKKMVVLSAKFTILISWSHICIPLILLSALKKLARTSAAILYNSMESKHPWQTHIMVEGSDRRPFILILDVILLYATLSMSMNLPPYPNLCKSEKIKSTLRIL